MSIVHEGLKLYRLDSNPMERAYHDAWLERQTQGPYDSTSALRYILSAGGCLLLASERDALVAATVIQWLGSPAGMSFVAGVQGNAK